MFRKTGQTEDKQDRGNMYAAVTNPPDICYPLIFAEHFSMR